MSFQNFENSIHNNAVVSFDLINTLIEKPFIQQQDFFNLMSQEVNKILGTKNFNFTKIRLLAEQNIKEKKITFDLNDIYKEFQNLTDLNYASIMEIEKLELCYEQKFYQIKPIGLQLYEIAKKLNKKIIIIAETSLPHFFIENFIERNNLVIDQFFLSHELHLTKKNGQLFSHALNKMHCSPQYMIHIGANEQTDLIVPEKLQINTLPIMSNQETYCNSLYYKKIWNPTKKENILSTNLINGLFSTNFFNTTNSNSLYSDKSAFNQQPERVGYFSLGPILLAFTLWLIQHSKQEHVKQLIFINDSTKIFEKSLTLLNENPNLQTTTFNLTEKECLAYYQQQKYNILEEFPNISKENIEVIQANAQEITSNVTNRLKHSLIQNQEKVAIVDLYSSDKQNILTNLSKQKIHGYYLSTHVSDLDNIKSNGLSIEGFIDSFSNNKNSSIYELFHFSDNNNENLDLIHDAAILFIKDFIALFKKHISTLYFSPQQVILPGMFFLTHEDEKKLKFFKIEPLIENRKQELYEHNNDTKPKKLFLIDKIIQKIKKEL